MDLKFDKDKNICVIKLTGLLSRDTILHAFDAAVSHVNYQPGMGRLWDFRKADLSLITAETISSMAKYSMNFPAGINDVKVAFAVTRDLEYGLTRMFESFSAQAKTKINVFKSLEEAEDWLVK